MFNEYNDNMIKILFVCHGNICRSPMAEYIFKNMVNDAGLGDKFLIDSAATSREEIGNDIYPPAKVCLQAHQIPFGTHHAKQITAQHIAEFDYIVAMEQYNVSNLAKQFADAKTNKFTLLLDYTDQPGDISDPWYSGDFETAYLEIERGCQALLRTCTLFDRQKELLDTFLKSGAITKAQYDKSLGDLRIKMGIK